MPWKSTTISGLLLLLAAGPLAAQSVIEIPDEVNCPDCEIVLTPITTIGKMADDVALRMDSQFAIDHERERIYVGQTYLPGAIVMYDFDGNLLGTFGRSGEGPGNSEHL